MKPGPGVSTSRPTAIRASVFHGKVESISGATGARFALLPPDNSTGNFVKVTQRVPVKIVLTRGPDSDHPLAPRHERGRLGQGPGIETAPPMAEQGLRKLIITITVIAAAIIELIDTSIVNVALNDMSGNLGATLEDVAWVVTAYAIANVIIIPMTSFLAARFGRRNYYIGSILLFTAASVACGNAHNIWELVAFRFIQGIGGGALLSTSQAILFETFTVAQRGFASSLFAVGLFVGPDHRPDARRMDHRPLFLALDILHQPPDRPRRRVPLLALREGARPCAQRRLD